MTDDNRPDITSNQAFQINVCMNNYKDDNKRHALKAYDGHYHSTGHPVRFLCCSCAKHNIEDK